MQTSIVWLITLDIALVTSVVKVAKVGLNSTNFTTQFDMIVVWKYYDLVLKHFDILKKACAVFERYFREDQMLRFKLLVYSLI